MFALVDKVTQEHPVLSSYITAKQCTYSWPPPRPLGWVMIKPITPVRMR